MHSASPYDPHHAVSWAQIPHTYNGHLDGGHLAFPPHSGALTPGGPAQNPQLFAADYPRNYPRPAGINNGGIFPSPPFSTSSQVRAEQ